MAQLPRLPYGPEAGSFDCLHCGTIKAGYDAQDANVGRWVIRVLTCKVCEERTTAVFFAAEPRQGFSPTGPAFVVSPPKESGFYTVVFPEAAGLAKSFPNAPQAAYRYYLEGAKVLPVVPRLAAVSYRVCLESIMRELGYSNDRLADRIDALTTDTKRHVPSQIVDTLASLKDAGNIASHDSRDIAANVIEIDQDEVELCKTAIEMMFDEFWERPKKLDVMKGGVAAKKTAWSKGKRAAKKGSTN